MRPIFRDRGDPLFDIALKQTRDSDEEEELLRGAGWEGATDAEARAEYEALFPPADDVVRRVRDLTGALQSSDDEKRLQAANMLLRAACKREAWLNTPLVTGFLIEALPRATGKVEEILVRTLDLTLEWFADARALPVVRPLLASKSARVRASAVSAALSSGREQAIGDVLPLLRDGTADVRRVSFLSMLTSEAFRSLPETARREVQASAIAALGDRVFQVKEVAISLLGAIGDGDALAALKQMKERRMVIRDAVAGAIASIVKRHGSATTAAKPARASRTKS